MAVINAFGPLVKTRHTLASKIINAFLAVDIVNIPKNSPDPLKTQLQLRSVAKTLRIHLSHFLRYVFVKSTNLRTNAGGPLSNRIDYYLRTSHANGIIIDEDDISRKRPATDDLSQPSKKVKMDSEAQPITIDPAISAAFLLDLTNPFALYEAQSIPVHIATEIIVRTLEILPSQTIEDRLNVYSLVLSI